MCRLRFNRLLAFLISWNVWVSFHLAPIYHETSIQVWKSSLCWNRGRRRLYQWILSLFQFWNWSHQMKNLNFDGNKVKAKCAAGHFWSYHHTRSSCSNIRKRTRFTCVSAHAYHNTGWLCAPIAYTLSIASCSKLLDGGICSVKATFCLSHTPKDCNGNCLTWHRPGSTWVWFWKRNFSLILG